MEFNGRLNLVLSPALLLGSLLSAGCAQYHVGNRSLYAPDVQTVYVPMIEASSFRRDLGERLTEAVVKEIELKTPYKVVGTPDADSILSARLVSDSRRVVVENAFDQPRALDVLTRASVTWLNRRRQPIGPVVDIQSVATAHQLAIERLAEQIVATMEQPW